MPKMLFSQQLFWEYSIKCGLRFLVYDEDVESSKGWSWHRELMVEGEIGKEVDQIKCDT